MKFISFIFAAVVSFSSVTALANNLLSKLYSHIRGTMLSIVLDPPPIIGSDVDRADFRELHYWQQHRTRAQCDAANREVNFFLRHFVGSRTDLLSPKEELRLTKDVSVLQLQVLSVAMDMKKSLVRLRPYVADRTIKPCLPPENSGAYPSAHAAIAYAMAESLSTTFPERRDLFLQRAQEVAFNRMMGGVHHRTDLIAGEKLGRFYGQRKRLHLE